MPPQGWTVVPEPTGWTRVDKAPEGYHPDPQATALGHHAGTISDAPEAPQMLGGGLHEMLQSAAHPETASDFASLLIPAGVSTAIGAGKAYLTAAKDAVAGGSTLKQVPQRMLGTLTKRAFPGEPMFTRPTASGGVEVPSRAFNDLPLHQQMDALPETAAPAGTRGPGAPYRPEPPTGPHMDMSQPVRAGSLTQDQIGERFAAAKAQGYQPPPKPISGPLVHRDLYGKTPAPLVQVDTASLPESWKPLADTQQPHPLDPMRQDIGAAQTGRATGMTKQAVRDAATPILGAEPGAASPILPEKALQKIVDTLKELPRGGPEREAYVARATSGKTQWQVENIRRTLEHLGLVAPLAIGGAGLRGAMLSQMNGEQR